MNQLPKILCVDDEPAILQGLALNLRRRFDFHAATDTSEALRLLHVHRFAIIMSDMRMPKMDGATFLAMARKIQPGAIRVVLTGQADLEASFRAINAGEAFRFLLKPCPPAALLSHLDAAVALHDELSRRPDVALR